MAFLRDLVSFRWIDDARRDVMFAARGLIKSPGFAAVAILTIALGIGANTAIFSVVNAVLLTSLPYPDADRLVRGVENRLFPDGISRRGAAMSPAEMKEFASRARSITAITAFGGAGVTFTTDKEAFNAQVGLVSPSFFSVLGVSPVMGRVFDPKGSDTSVETSAVISHGAWQRLFGGDPNILGRVIVFDTLVGPGVPADGRGYTVIGVMPPSFQFPDERTQIWMPYAFPFPRVSTLARLAPGVTATEAATELETVLVSLRGQPAPNSLGPAPGQPRYEFISPQELLVAPIRPALRVLTAAVGFVLLIACANVAGLLLARTAARQREIAVRMALGAGRARLIRQLLAESMLLASIGAAAGIALAFGGLRLLKNMGGSTGRFDIGSGANLPRLSEVGVDGSVLAFTTLLALVTGVLFGLAPAIRHSRGEQLDGLRDGITPAVSGFGLFRRGRARGLLVVAEIAMAVMLLSGGGLLIHSFVKLANVDPGYQPARVVTFQVPLPASRYPVAALKTFCEDFVARIDALPGVEASTYAHQLPMVQLRQGGGGYGLTPAEAIARPGPDTPERPDARLVSTRYFEVMGFRMVQGRGFAQTDRLGQQPAVIINQTLAKRDFPNKNPIGQTVFIGAKGDPWQIIGVVADVKQFGLDREPSPQFFVDFRQWPGTSPVFDIPQYFAVKTRSESAAIITDIRAILGQMDSSARVDNVATMSQLIDATISRQRLYAVLLGIFAGVAVVLAAIGIYGLIAYSVAQRTREIGIRIALGAKRGEVMGLVLKESLLLTALGLALGLGAAAAVTGSLKSMLFGLTPLDPTTFVIVAIVFAAIATLASFVPARRATKVDPLVALRVE